MTDTTVKKIHAPDSPKGEMGQTYLVSGKRGMRLWEQESLEAETRRCGEYETVGYVNGRAELELRQTVRLEPGDRGWCCGYDTATRSSSHHAIEATAPPSQVHGRDEPARMPTGPRGSNRSSLLETKVRPLPRHG